MFSKLISNWWFQHSHDQASNEYQIAQENVGLLFRTLEQLLRNTETEKDVRKVFSSLATSFLRLFDTRLAHPEIKLDPFVMIGNYWHILTSMEAARETVIQRGLKNTIMKLLHAYNHATQTDEFIRYIDCCDFCDRCLAFTMISHQRLGIHSRFLSRADDAILRVICSNIRYQKRTQDESRKFIKERMRTEYTEFVISRLREHEKSFRNSHKWDLIRDEYVGTRY